MHALEDSYWWFVARRHLITTLLRDLNPQQDASILDIGCGTGAMLDELKQFGTVFGADYSPEALSFCKQRGRDTDVEYRLTQADVRRLPYQSNSLDIVTAMDVIEHIDDDKAALSEIRRVLKPGGMLLATVPAFQFLWSDHDVALHHFRRYTSGGFRDVVQRSGLTIEKLSYTVSTLFPVVWLYRLATRLTARNRKQSSNPQADLVSVNTLVNKMLIALCQRETRLVRKMNLPIGVTVVAVARKVKITVEP